MAGDDALSAARERVRQLLLEAFPELAGAGVLEPGCSLAALLRAVAALLEAFG